MRLARREPRTWPASRWTPRCNQGHHVPDRRQAAARGDQGTQSPGQHARRAAAAILSAGRMVSPDRLRKGANMLKRYGSILKRIEDRYGVPAEVLVAIWGLESDYGVNQGKYSTVRSLATLAYDCRRSEKFQAELLDALRLIERGDLTSGDSWCGCRCSCRWCFAWTIGGSRGRRNWTWCRFWRCPPYKFSQRRIPCKVKILRKVT